jgi:hypothetical protein
MLYVGRRVRCVNARNWPTFRHVPEMLPVEGETYTVFDIRQNPDWDEPGVLLEEIVNMVGEHEWLLYFRASRFVSRWPTDISVFKAMLEPAPEPVRIEIINIASVAEPI